jgi:hypothetical protein|tara:strand:+ start:214 stop:864 length:651 start_codon:yes stop_codon:yes gene_type:complete
MSTFTQYLTEAAKSYDYKIKVAGNIDKDFASRMETALAKFEVAKMSAGKKTPIMTLPLDFPMLSNESVTIYDVTTNYPASSNVMKEYLSDILRVPATHIVVRKPGEPTEEYQDAMQVAKKSEFANKVADVEQKFQDNAPNGRGKADDLSGDKYNMSLMRELLKDKEDRYEITKGTDDKVGNVMPSEDDKKAGSPVHPGPGPVKGNPHPATLQGFKQ